MPYHYDSRNYDPNAEFEPELIPPGDYLCKVENARWDTTRNGYEMIVLQLAVKGFRSKLWYNVVCKCDTPEEQKRTDQWVGAVFAAFGLTPSPDVEVAPLVGRVGGVHVKNETRDGETRSRAGYLLKRDKARSLVAKSAEGPAANDIPFEASAQRAQPQSYRDTPARTTGPKGAPGFDRYGDSYPPAPLDIGDLEARREASPLGPASVPAEEEDIPF